MTDLASGATLRFKPKAKAHCTGKIIYREVEVGSLKTIALVCSPTMVGGRFSLEWHRMGMEERLIDALAFEILYQERGQPNQQWRISDVQIMAEGVPLGIVTLNELFGQEIAFFARSLETL